MVTEKSCSLSELQVDLAQEKGSGTSSASPDLLSTKVVPIEKD